jgi:hypothetical protein
MSPNVLFFGWNRSMTGRESLSAQHFKDFSEYLAAQKSQGAIDSFEAVLLEPTGGNLNGFFLIRGASDQLNKLTASPEWSQHITRAILHLDQPIVTRGVNGSALMEQMGMWMKTIPQA